MFIRDGVSKQLKKKGGNAISMIKIYVRNFENFTEIHCGSRMAETKTDLDARQAENPLPSILSGFIFTFDPVFWKKNPSQNLDRLRIKIMILGLPQLGV